MKSLMNYISFTKNETKVILFIVTVLVAGLSIKYFKQVINGGPNTSFDFSKSDSEFIAKSSVLDSKLSSQDIDTSDIKNNLNLKRGTYDDSIILKLELSEPKLFEDFSGKKVNINVASKEELIDLPGIGESIAEKIISYRNEKNGFKKAEELMNVSGIGKKKFEKIKPYIKSE